MKSNWLVAEKFEDDFGKGWGYSEILLQLFWNREIKSREAAGDFLKSDYAKIHDPYLFPDMKKAVVQVKPDQKIDLFEIKEKK